MNKSKHIRYGMSITLFTTLICMLIVYATPVTIEDNAFGIDISKWNQEIDFSNLSDVEYVIIRLGYTTRVDGETLKLDDYYKYNISQCLKYNIPFGVYFYSLADEVEDAIKEANFVLDNLNGIKPPLGIFYDIEDSTYQGSLTIEQLSDIVVKFTDIIKHSNNIAGVYANTYWWNNKLDYTRFEDCYLWIANYNTGFIPEEHFHIFQYTDEGKINGYDGNFDFNIIKYIYW